MAISQGGLSTGDLAKSSVGAGSLSGFKSGGGGGGGGGGFTPWDLSTLPTAESASFSFVGKQAVPLGAQFSPDGSLIFLTGQSPASIQSWAVPTPFDVTSIVAAPVNAAAGGLVDTDPSGLFVHPDGDKIYWVGNTNNAVYQRAMSTPFDITTLGATTSYVTSLDSVTTPVDVCFKSDGTEMYVIEIASSHSVSRFTLSTPWDVTTATYQDQYAFASDVGTVDCNGLWVNGTELYIIATNNYLHKWTWDGLDISTCTAHTSKAITGYGAGTWGLYMNSSVVLLTSYTDDKFHVWNWGPH